MKRLALCFLLLASPAAAQQPSPSQTALAINQAVTQMAMSLESSNQIVAQLKAQIDLLRAKCGDPCKDVK